MNLDGETVSQVGGLAAFASAVLWMLRQHFVKADKREDDAAEARKKTDERHAAAAEAQAKATAELAAAMAGVATELRSQGTALTSLAGEVRDLAGEVKEIRDDRETPVQRPPMASRYAVRGPGGREG